MMTDEIWVDQDHVAAEQFAEATACDDQDFVASEGFSDIAAGASVAVVASQPLDFTAKTAEVKSSKRKSQAMDRKCRRQKATITGLKKQLKDAT